MFADIVQHAKNLRRDPAFQAGYSEIIDIRDAEQLDFQADEFIKMADEIDPFSAEARRAFVVRTAIQNRRAGMHKALRNARKMEVFLSLEDAERWILS